MVEGETFGAADNLDQMNTELVLEDGLGTFRNKQVEGRCAIPLHYLHQ